MFGASQFLQRRKNSNANYMGFYDAVLGLDKANPFSPNTIDYTQWELGWNEGQEVLQETIEVHNISNEYESGW